MVAEKHNYSKLRGRIVEMYGSCSNLSKEEGYGRSLLSLKLNNKMNFTQKDIIKLCDKLNIQRDEVGTYFFTPLV